jgi:CheY-like chemotaxis protein
VEAELREADQRKNEFLATLAHELRNPLAPLRNGLEILRSTQATDAVAERALGVMDRQLRQMVRLIDDLLDLSRISLGRIELRRERVDLAQVLQNAIEISRPLIAQSGHELVIDAAADVPAAIVVNADLTRLAQVFANLLNNAAKYTERGGRITVSAERVGDNAVVRVSDTGIGIPPHMLKRIFEMFTQVDRSLEKAQGGLGIGLSISKRLVEMHGGTLTAASAGIGRGSELTVHLPLAGMALSSPPTAKDESQGGLRPKRIVVADDNVDAAVSLAMMLEMSGNETRTAHDGLEAVEMVEAFAPDAVVLDIGMPKLNGYEACRRIRALPGGERMLIVAMTGWGQDQDKRLSQEAGFDYHLVKPVEPAALERILEGMRAGG